MVKIRLMINASTKDKAFLKIAVFILKRTYRQDGVFFKLSSVSIKSVDEAKIIVDEEFHFLFSFVMLKTTTGVLFAIRLEHAIT